MEIPTREVDVTDLIEGIGGSRRRDVETQSRQEDYNAIKKMLIQERMGPEILPFGGDVIDRVMERVRNQIEFIEQNSLELDSSKKDMKFILLLVESELERIKFVIRAYLRCRLTKIDKYAMYIRQDPQLVDRLSPSEKEYMNKHQAILKDLYMSQFLASMPTNLQKLDDTAGGISMVEEFDMDQAVIFRVTKTLEEPLLLGNDQLELTKGILYAARYSAVKSYMEMGVVELV